MSIQSELEKTLNTKKKRSEKPDDYRKRLAQAIQDVPDDDWEALSEDAQLWVNASAKAIEAGKSVPEFTDEEGEEEEEPAAVADASDDDDDEEEEKKKPAKKAAAKKAAAGNGEKAPSTRGSMCRDIKKIVIKHPNYSVEELVDAASKAGLSPSRSTLSTIRSDTRDTIKIMQDAGIVDMGV